MNPAVGAPKAGDVPGQRSPFQGLGFYTEDDAKWFFGRTVERKVILAHLRTAPLTVLYAESGVGKSSLLRAGVAARLRELAARTSAGGRAPRFVPVVFSAWKDDPVADLIAEIDRQASPMMPAAAPASNGGGPERASALVPDPTPTGLADAIRRAAAALDATLVIILDQFEEHFSYRIGARDPDRVADELARCIRSSDVPANFLIAVREDAYGRLGDLFGGRIANVYDNYLHLEYLSREAAREAIEKPVEIYNSERDPDQAVVLEDDLADAVLDQVRRGRLDLGGGRVDRDGGDRSSNNGADEIETPFLQLVMTRLWERERTEGSRVLRTATLDDELGGAETIVRNHVSGALAGLAGQELDTATDIFRDLVTPSGAKVAHTAIDLAQMTAHSQDTVATVLNRLYEERILRAVDPAPGTTDARYEIYHDRLAAPILDWRDQQENARLEQARQHAEVEAETQRDQARRFKRRARIMLGLVVGLLLLLVAVAVLLKYANDTSNTAGRERRSATYFGLASRAQAQFANRPDVSLLLELAAYSENPQRLAARNLVATLQGARRSGAIGLLHGHTDAVEDIAFSPAGGTLASVSGDKTLRLWSVTRSGHRPLGSPMRANSPLYSAAWDPTGRTIASGGVDDVILWSIANHRQETTIPDDAGAVTSVAFSPNGNLLAAGGSNGTILIWNVSTHRRTVLHVPGRTPVTSVEFSPDAPMLAASSAKSVFLWSTGDDRPLGKPLTGDTGSVYTVAFGRDGNSIAAAGSSGRIIRWALDTRRPFGPSLVGLSAVFSIAFSPNGKELAAGGATRTMIWQLSTGRRGGQPLDVRQGAVNSVAFSPDGRFLASAGADQMITLWKNPPGREYGIPILRGTNGRLAISPDGQLLAAGSTAGQIFLLNLPDRRVVQLPNLGNGGVGALAFDRRRALLAAAYYDGIVRLWRYRSGTPVGPPLRSDTSALYAVAFSRDGTHLAAGGTNGTIRLWNLRTHSPQAASLTGGTGAVYAVAFTPDSRVLASGGADRAIRFWDARTHVRLDPALIAQNSAVFALTYSPGGRLLASGGSDDTVHVRAVGPHSYPTVHTLAVDTNLIRALAFSPDGHTLASGSTDDIVRLWDVRSGQQLGGALTGHRASVESVAFTRNGQILASGSSDGTVRLWEAAAVPPSAAALRSQVCSFVGGGLSRAEWAQYAPDIPYHQSCPLTTPS
jgi:WD40 repeat protein/tetrahydromethanopterin S-methyltransferase subunit G